jgi:hypothetical protein
MALPARVLVRPTLFLATALMMAGCASPERPITVSGKVTFKGDPVTEGSVQFTDESTGRGSEVDLRPDGTYEASLFAGNYKVVITPPYLVDNSSGMPNPKYKKVKNIPAKYHSTATSGLSAVVSADQATHDFSLAP